MRKKALSVIFALLLFAFCMASIGIFSGCNVIRFVKSIGVGEENEIHEVFAGEPSLSGLTVRVNYSDGKTEEFPLTEDMLPAYELTKFYKIGRQDVKIVYEGKECVLRLDVKRKTFDGDMLFEAKTFTYDGKTHSVSVTGSIPEKAQIKYPNGNSFVNAGTYKVTAVIVCDGYESKTMETELTIEKAVYDESAIRFEDKTFDYDGDPKLIKAENVSGDVTVVYEMYGSDGKTRVEEAVNAGVYIERMKLVFKGENYYPAAEREAKITIRKTSYNIGNIPFLSQKVTYDQKPHSLVIADLSRIPAGIGVSYSVYKADGLSNERCMTVPLSDLEKTARALNAGTYLFVASFEGSNQNYENLPEKRAVLTIEKAKIQAQSLTLPSLACAYDGQMHSLQISGSVPSGVKVSYTYNGVAASGAVLPGTYTVVATLIPNDRTNYSVVPSSVSATLIISGSSEG